MDPRKCYKVVPYDDGWAVDRWVWVDGKPMYVTVGNFTWEHPDRSSVVVFPSEDAAWAWAGGKAAR